MYSVPIINDQDRPLVSVLIFNYNYGRYLRECLDSVYAQTYDNIEICFSDNASTDESWNIALEYAQKYPGTMTITRNRKNFGSDANFANCFNNIRGKYFIELCSDDAMMPEYIEQCVHVMEGNPKAGFIMVHRTIIDEHGYSTEEPPFYNQSCVIPGAEQAAVYMMAAVNPSVSQIMYNFGKIHGKTSSGSDIAGHWYCTRITDFNMCCEYDMAYIKEPLLLHRLHSKNNSFWAAGNLMEVIGPFVLQHQFAEVAKIYNMTKVIERLPQSLEKLGKLCLRYCVRALEANEETTALRYFHLAIAISPDVCADPAFNKLEEYWAFNRAGDHLGKLRIIDSLKSTDNLKTRSVSYDPPPGSIPLEVNSHLLGIFV